MVKVRLCGTLKEVNKLAEIISGLSPQVCILECSRNYRNRGASVYQRVYMDVELHEIAQETVNVSSKFAITKRGKK